MPKITPQTRRPVPGGPAWHAQLRQLDALMGRIDANQLTLSELRRLNRVFADVDDRLAGRKRKPARMLYLVRDDHQDDAETVAQ